MLRLITFIYHFEEKALSNALYERLLLIDHVDFTTILMSTGDTTLTFDFPDAGCSKLRQIMRAIDAFFRFPSPSSIVYFLVPAFRCLARLRCSIIVRRSSHCSHPVLVLHNRCDVINRQVPPVKVDQIRLVILL